MQNKILFVDDEANVLSGFRRQLGDAFELDTASSGAEGLELLSKNGPYAVVVSDMRMPQMDGIAFLARARELAPDTVRIMLTGNADVQTAMNAVNEGRIFRFLTKPCPVEILTSTLESGLEYYRLVTAEAQLLEKTLVGCVSVLTEILCFTDPAAFNRAKKLRDYARGVAKAVCYRDKWQLELAALLAEIGQLTLPSELRKKSRDTAALSEKEQAVLARVPEIGRNLLVKIPRLDIVSDIVLYQNKQYNGTGFPTNGISGEDIPLGARILKILSDLVALEDQRVARSVALRMLRSRVGWYDPAVLEAISAHFIPPLSIITLKEKEEPAPRVRTVSQKLIESLGIDGEEEQSMPIAFSDLLVGDLLRADIRSRDDIMLLPAGSTITTTKLEALRNYAEWKGVREPVFVAVQ